MEIFQDYYDLWSLSRTDLGGSKKIFCVLQNFCGDHKSLGMPKMVWFRSEKWSGFKAVCEILQLTNNFLIEPNNFIFYDKFKFLKFTFNEVLFGFDKRLLFLELSTVATSCLS